MRNELKLLKINFLDLWNFHFLRFDLKSQDSKTKMFCPIPYPHGGPYAFGLKILVSLVSVIGMFEKISSDLLTQRHCSLRLNKKSTTTKKLWIAQKKEDENNNHIQNLKTSFEMQFKKINSGRLKTLKNCEQHVSWHTKITGKYIFFCFSTLHIICKNVTETEGGEGVG